MYLCLINYYYYYLTRLIGQLKDNLEEEHSHNVLNLRQQTSLLSAKLEILSKIDAEILELTPEDDIEQEIDLADQTKEKVCLAVNGIDHALNQAGQQVIPASVSLPSENPARPAHTTRGSTLHHLPHSSPEATPHLLTRTPVVPILTLNHPLPQMLHLQTHLW